MSAVMNIWGLPGDVSVFSNLFSFNWGVNDSMFGRYSPHRNVNEVAVTRKPDKFSNLLVQMCSSGDTVDTIKFTMTYTDDDGLVAKGGLILSGSTISSLNVTGQGKVESIVFVYSSAQYER
jgi:type VI protein secretion system component Hcp